MKFCSRAGIGELLYPGALLSRNCCCSSDSCKNSELYYDCCFSSGLMRANVCSVK